MVVLWLWLGIHTTSYRELLVLSWVRKRKKVERKLFFFLSHCQNRTLLWIESRVMFLQNEKYPDTVHDWAQNYLDFAKHRNLEIQWNTSINRAWRTFSGSSCSDVRMFCISLFLFSQSCHFCPLFVFHVFWVLFCLLPCVPLVFSCSSPVCFSLRTCSASSSLAQPCSQCASQPYNSLPALLGFYTHYPHLCFSISTPPAPLPLR